VKLVRWSLVLGCIAGVAAAQEPRPTVAPFPLELRRVPSGFSKKEREDLQKIFPILLRAAGAAVPDAARLSAATNELKRQDCDREDACLAQLAKLSGSLYAVYVGVDYTLEKHVVVTGRVVRDDGVVSRALQTVDIVKEGAFRDVARDGVNQLLSKLDVMRLPSVREVAVVKKDPEPVIKKDPDPIVTKKDPDPLVPPPLPPVDTGAGQRTAGMALLIGGGAVALAGGVIAGVGGGMAGGIERDGNVTTSAGAKTAAEARTLTGVGFAVLGVGAAAGVLGGLLFAMAPSAPVSSVSVVPVNGGGVVQFGGQF
jgi:hypothetical protein